MQQLSWSRKKTNGDKWEDPFNVDLENNKFKEMFVPCLKDMEEDDEGF